MEVKDLKAFWKIKTEKEFEELTWKTFNFQYKFNKIYNSFCKLIDITPEKISKINEIPFLPISLFKSKKVISSKNHSYDKIFKSSMATGNSPSIHYVKELKDYKKSYRNCFSLFYGPPKNYAILALLPSYQEESSLIYMANDLIKITERNESGFYLDEFENLYKSLIRLEKKGQKTILLGVSHALLGFSEKYDFKLKNTIIMETGGMKGKRKELTREELHEKLAKSFKVEKIHSEYGMTELLSQAYSSGNGLYKTPPWMRIYIRENEDPFTESNLNQTGGINIIDLANRYSCSFIETEDMGKVNSDGSFEIIGRIDNSEIRGCNLMVL